ncbi:uncharacterized protein [Littorina saxatilis]|uniref:uncharacterized protein isoform X2 n=1 Tax=Littorina saxatilis TaxID=31220 RepID=UPI0038B4EC46
MLRHPKNIHTLYTRCYQHPGFSGHRRLTPLAYQHCLLPSSGNNLPMSKAARNFSSETFRLLRTNVFIHQSQHSRPSSCVSVKSSLDKLTARDLIPGARHRIIQKGTGASICGELGPSVSANVHHQLTRACLSGAQEAKKIVPVFLQHSRQVGKEMKFVSRLFHHSSRSELRLSEEVREALHTGKPVVALESTIITHGMPHPHNEQTALSVEQIIRHLGAIPATVAVLKGQVCVGLSASEIQWLAEKSSQLVKISRRDLPVVMAQGLSGGTTVSGTMIAAHKAGIPIFATGGIGGVHRGVEETLDVSADLRELGRTPVAVVSAGVKSILDIPRTLEYLETEGVCVVTYGPNADFPAFFAPSSGHNAPYHVNSPDDAADIIDASLQSKLQSGMLFGVPVPEEFAASGEMIEHAIHKAVKAAKRLGVKGKEVTPFILQQVYEITEGASLGANIALIENNAKVAAQIAVALSRKKNGTQRRAPSATFPGVSSPPSAGFSDSVAKKPVVVGGVVVDFCAKAKEEDIKMYGATYPGKIYQSFGGVGRNVADCMSRLGNPPFFVSALGDDVHATALFNNCSHMDLRGVTRVAGQSTPTYCPVLTSDGHVMFGIGDMDLLSVVSPDMISQYQTDIAAAPIVCVDGNFSPEVIERVCKLCSDARVPVWFEPTDVHKATKPFMTSAWKHLTYTSPNLHEAACMWMSVTGQPEKMLSESASVEEMLKVAVDYCTDLLHHIPVVMVTLGKYGLLLGNRDQDDPESPIAIRFYPAGNVASDTHTVNVSGAGDCLNAGMMHFIIQGHNLDLSIKAGLMAAQHSLQSHSAVPASITPEGFTAEKVEEWARFKATDLTGSQSLRSF